MDAPIYHLLCGEYIFSVSINSTKANAWNVRPRAEKGCSTYKHPGETSRHALLFSHRTVPEDKAKCVGRFDLKIRSRYASCALDHRVWR